MGAQQTSVAYQDEGFAGQLADSSDLKNARSYLNENATEIAFGLAVAGGTDPDRGVILPASNASTVRGVSLHDHAYAKDGELGSIGLKQYASVSALRHGTVKVYCSEAVVVDTSAVRIRMDTNAGTGALLGPGTFCVSSSAGHTVLVTAGMKWVKGCGAGGIAHLEVDMTAFAKTND